MASAVVFARGQEFEGKARVEGAAPPIIDDEAQTEGKARVKAGEGSGGSVIPVLPDFLKFKLEIVQFSHLVQSKSRKCQQNTPNQFLEENNYAQ